MQRVSIPAAGGYDKLQVKSVAEPTVGANVVDPEASDMLTVEVAAAGINYADVCIRWGLYESAKKYVGWPITPGFEFAGVVQRVQAGVDRFKVGDKVFGVSLFGGYSSQIRVPQHQVFPLPDGFSFEQAAAFPAVALTAYFAMFELAHPRPGQRVLIHSAAGGVGSSLVQLAKIAGCHVVGVVGSTHKIEHARRMGCDFVIDKSKQDLWAAAKDAAKALSRRPTPASSVDGPSQAADPAASVGSSVNLTEPNEERQLFHAIFDANGVSTLSQSYAHLAPTGKLVVYGFHSMLPKQGGVLSVWRWLRMAWDYIRTPRFNPLELTSANKSVMAFNLSFLFRETRILHEAMERFGRWLEAGTFSPPTVTAFPLADVAKAHEAIESGKTVGKLVLLPASPERMEAMRRPHA